MAGYGATAPYTMYGQMTNAVTQPAVIDAVGSWFNNQQQPSASLNSMPQGYVGPQGNVSQGNVQLDQTSQMNLNRML